MQTLRQCDISIIIPCYNLEQYIKPMLESLKSQKLEWYTAEVIFVLNNCTDYTEAVIRQSGIRCKIMQCTTQGCGPARNTGFEAARGNYVWFMDGDDWLLSDTAVKDVLDKAYSEDLNVLRIPFGSDGFTFQYFSMVWQYLFKREFISDLRFPDYQPSEDDAYTRAVLQRVGISNHLALPCMDKALYWYNYGRPGSNMVRYREGTL